MASLAQVVATAALTSVLTITLAGAKVTSEELAKFRLSRRNDLRRIAGLWIAELQCYMTDQRIPLIRHSSNAYHELYKRSSELIAISDDLTWWERPVIRLHLLRVFGTMSTAALLMPIEAWDSITPDDPNRPPELRGVWLMFSVLKQVDAAGNVRFDEMDWGLFGRVLRDSKEIADKQSNEIVYRAVSDADCQRLLRSLTQLRRINRRQGIIAWTRIGSRHVRELAMRLKRIWAG